MHEYGLTSEEGIILMCLAEALLRIPDADTADALIAEKIGEGRWEKHLGASDSWFVNASTFGLMLTGRVVRLGEDKGTGPAATLKRLIARSGEPIIRQAVRQAMRILGDNFVLGRTIEEALDRAEEYEAQGYRFSFDMLGERAKTAADAERYLDRYRWAIEAIGKRAGPPPADGASLMARPSISVKLSAIHPRFDPGKETLLHAELLPRVVELAAAARMRGLGLTIDAEEQDRLDMTLGLFAAAFRDEKLEGWPGLGLAVQAYGKRALPVLRWLEALAEDAGRLIPVRLVKGAYWDSEIKWAQERGLADYPVFTRKAHTDVSYLAAMRFCSTTAAAFFPQFATHNAHTIAAVYEAAGEAPSSSSACTAWARRSMPRWWAGQAARRGGRPCRIYAPVGPHEDLVAYLVRRLLENGANTSFVNRLADEAAPVDEMVRHPHRDGGAGAAAQGAAAAAAAGHLLSEHGATVQGWRSREPSVRAPLVREIEAELARPVAARPIVSGVERSGGAAEPVLSPHDHRVQVGTVRWAEAGDVEAALAAAHRAADAWDRLGGPARAAILDKAADLYERDRARLMAVMVREAGKTLDNALGDVREAVDFLRYYASEARRLFAGAIALPGPTGETNTLALRGARPVRGDLALELPAGDLHGPGGGGAGGRQPRARQARGADADRGVAGGAAAARGGRAADCAASPARRRRGRRRTHQGCARGGRRLHRLQRHGLGHQPGAGGAAGRDLPFIAETGGMNAMIADSSALPEQVIRDVVRSAFDSAGQRCSAARLFFVQEDVAKAMIDMLVGAVEVLAIGDPLDYATDVGPVIDADAKAKLEAHKARMRKEARELVDLPVPEACAAGTYVGPAVYEIARADVLKEEVFGPILHVVRFQGGHLDRVIDAINATGYGLTLGLHSRIEAVADLVAERARVGNLYVNRNQIGAVVGVQPFGGEGLSGTGPKAGGPHYLPRFATERVRTTDITATGGNVGLLGLGEFVES